MTDGDADPSIAAHRLLGDGRSTALLRPDGQIDWWCAPEVDSPPLLWSLLDPGGAAARWADVRMVSRSQLPAGPTAHTVLRHRSGARVECWDGLVGIGGAEALVRAVRAPGRNPLVLTHELALGGFDGPWGPWSAMRSTLADTDVWASAATGSTDDGRWLRVALAVEPQRWSVLAVVVGADVDPVDEAELVDRLASTEAEHDAILGSARLPRHHPERSRDALAVLRTCTDRRTGAVVAS
nr:DUF5911 domain-containing protein [Actinomycetota bacterium]